VSIKCCRSAKIKVLKKVLVLPSLQANMLLGINKAMPHVEEG
jgi:hypothetical protein